MAVVLVVDDGVANRELIQAYLAGIDCTVRLVEDGAAALEAIETVAPDLVLLDVQMPGIDGYEVGRRIKAMPHGRLLPVGMNTALNQTRDRGAALEAGAGRHPPQPLDPAALGALPPAA